MVAVRHGQAPEQILIGLMVWLGFRGVQLGPDGFESHESIQPPQPFDVDIVAFTPTRDKRRSRSVLPQLEMVNRPC